MYNRKLKKYLKTCENKQTIEIDSNRDLFMEHGLHMNLKGKDQTAKKIVQSIKAKWNTKVSNPIMLKDREEMVEVAQTEVKEVQLTQENQINRLKNKEKISYLLNESENHLTHVIMIFYGWTGKQIIKCEN